MGEHVPVPFGERPQAPLDLYAVFGVPAPIALVVVLVYRLFSFWLRTVAGIVLVPYLEQRKSGADRVDVP